MTNNENQNRKWYLWNAEGQVLGRLSTQIADTLRGKKKTSFEKNKDVGDYVVIINANKIVLTGNKEEQKRYYKHTGYLGNLKTTTVPELRASKPEKIIEHAVGGMLPKNKLKDVFMGRLKIYSGKDHPHVNVKFENVSK